MIRYLARSFRMRLLLGSFLVCLLMVGALIYNSVSLADRYLQEQDNENIQSVGIAFSSAILPDLLTGDYASLRETLEEWRHSEHVNYLAVVTEEGSRIAVGWPDSASLPQPGESDGAMNAVFPIGIDGQQYGQLHIGMNTAFITRARQSMFEQSVLIAIIGIAALTFFMSLVIYYMTRRLMLLSDASIQVTEGNLDLRIQVNGHDEVAQLAENFNLMVDAIHTRMHELEDSELRFRAIADYTHAWENWFDPEGRLRWVNPAVQRITGYTPEECMQMEDFPLSLVHDNDKGLVRHQMRQALDGLSGQDMEFRITRNDGRSLWCAISWQSIHDAQGLSLGYRSSVRDITLQHHATEELAYQAIHDSLTGLFNRHAFEQQLQQVLGKHESQPVSILYLDLDQFKVINDTCGHSAGDQLLISLSKALQNHVGQDFLARLGGDEFGILMRNCDEDEAVRRAKALVDKIRSHVFTYGGRSFRIGASVGVVRAGPGMDNFTDILMAADTACYAAKDHGRNRVELYTEADEYFRLRHEEFRSIGHVTTALTEGRFLLYFQRLEPLRPGAPRHVEILIRLRDFLDNIQPPSRFINAAERFNLMPYIDRWVVENVCRQLAEWRQAGTSTGIDRYAINISGASLSDREFPDYVRHQITLHQINPVNLCFEITESCAIGQLGQALDFIEQMRSLGTALSLDDFGSGLSSFAYLKQFKVDYLKIDGQFVKNIDHDASDCAVVQAMVQLARAHGLKTVAEFVCSEAIYDVVNELGVDYAQGYACHIPEPLSNLGAED
ncbi:MAG: EAL domain-containing protein [Zoogloeaceae bacterium]|jgi:diguanylate cyclase (GGDEF)-like protein/PAS domain S-box-containing protein|nr:EAL domain-containing protein [Zoogloeaceae bacterium]